MTQEQKVVAVFFDAANHHASLNASNKKMNFLSFLKKLKKEFFVIDVRYYYCTSHLEKHAGVKELAKNLQKDGYTIVTKEAIHRPDGTTKGNMDVEIAVDAAELAGHCDYIILFSGDGDFTYLIKHIQKKGTKVWVCSDESNLSKLLREQADKVLNFSDI